MSRNELNTRVEKTLSDALEQAIENYMEAYQEMQKTGIFDTALLVELRDVIASDGHALTVFRQQEETQ